MEKIGPTWELDELGNELNRLLKKWKMKSKLQFFLSYKNEVGLGFPKI